MSSETSIDREPQSECERVLCRLVSEILDLENVGPDDDFFALGGSSLTAIKLISLVIEIFDVPLKLRVVLRNPRICELAEYIQQQVS